MSGYINIVGYKQTPPESIEHSDGMLGLFKDKMDKTLGNVWKRSSKDVLTQLRDIL